MTERRSRLILAVIVGLVAGLGGETLLFLQRQFRLVEAGLSEDFRVVLFLKPGMDEGKQKVVEEQLRALPDVEDVRAVSSQEQLAMLKKEDPELVESVSLIGDNPLNSAFEVQLAEGGIARVAQWAIQAQPLADWADLRYKPAQVQAILHAQFLTRFIDLSLAALLCLLAGVGLEGIWHTGRSGSKSAWRDGPLTAGVAGLGAAVGAGVVCAMVLPLKAVSPWWGWPPAAAQFALVAGSAAVGWVLCARRD